MGLGVGGLAVCCFSRLFTLSALGLVPCRMPIGV